MRVLIDASARTFVVICDCGWRSLGMTRQDAWSQARRHELRAHPGDRDTVRHADTSR